MGRPIHSVVAVVLLLCVAGAPPLLAENSDAPTSPALEDEGSSEPLFLPESVLDQAVPMSCDPYTQPSYWDCANHCNQQGQACGAVFCSGDDWFICCGMCFGP